MNTLFVVDWETIFVPSVPLVELVLRGTITYLGVFLLLRLVLKREAGTIGITDLLVVVLMADAAQNALAGGYESVTDGLLLVSIILFWSFTLDWLGYHFPALQRFVHPPALPLIKNGRLLRRNMRHELLTEDEVMSLLRQQGIEELGNVKLAYLEGDGSFSVIKRRKPADS